MNYEEAIGYISHLQEKMGSIYSITEVAALSDRVGRPDRKLKVLHIAGTNGKGSVSTFISNILAASGYSVGKYISPTIFDYREKIQKITFENNTLRESYISEEMVAEKMTQLESACRELVQYGYEHPSAYEIETIMAFLAFEDWGVDYAVIETGLGGRMDATNIIEHPLQCIITSISLEHQQVLGDSISKIAREKYGIIKKNTQVVSAKQEECFEILEEQVRRKGAELFTVLEEERKDVAYRLEGTEFSYRGVTYELAQLGSYQVDNALLAIESAVALQKLNADRITTDSIKRGLKISKWAGRFDILSKTPFVIIDGAHNPAGVSRLCESLDLYFPGEKFQLIFGTFSDKDYQKEMEILLPYAKRVFAVAPQGERGLSEKRLDQMIAAYAKTKNVEIDVIACASVQAAIEKSIAGGDAEKTVVCGSLSILGEVYRVLKEK